MTRTSSAAEPVTRIISPTPKFCGREATGIVGFLARYRQPGRVLDVGSAAGFILRGLIDCGWSGRGLEPNRTMAEFAREHLALDVECGNLEDYKGGETFDLITMFQSIMHFYDVRRACEVAASLTRPGGHWLIEAFNPHSWTGRLLGKHWHDYNPPSVLHWFSPEALRRLAQPYGLQPVAVGRAPKSISAAHAKSVLQLKLGSTACGGAILPLLKVVPDRLQIAYPGDDIFWALFTNPVPRVASSSLSGANLPRKADAVPASAVEAPPPAPAGASCDCYRESCWSRPARWTRPSGTAGSCSD